LEQTINLLQSELESTKSQLKRSSLSRSRGSSRGGSVNVRTPKSGRKSSIENLDVAVLNKRVQLMRKSYEEDKNALIKERIRNQELMVQIDKTNKKTKKMQIDVDKFSKVQTDYNRLMESFEKSEFIRQQQKQLIASLNVEIDQLKREQHNRDEYDKKLSNIEEVTKGKEKPKKKVSGKRSKSKSNKRLA